MTDARGRGYNDLHGTDGEAQAQRNAVGTVDQGWRLNPAVHFGGHTLAMAQSHPKPGLRDLCEQVGSRNPTAAFSDVFIRGPGRLFLHERERMLAAGGDMGFVPTPSLFYDSSGRRNRVLLSAKRGVGKSVCM